MYSQRPVNSKREEFRKYIEKAGIHEALMNIFTALYQDPEKPEDALAYLRKELNKMANEADLETLNATIESNILRIQSLNDEIKVLKEKLAKYEKVEMSVELEEPDDNPVAADSTNENIPPESATAVE